ncbi:MAG TPA: TonB-dependent receptor plug domain-containing protein [Acidobacteriaceae bacterium]|jgi:iron complex outermembrane receptor protein
MRARGHAAAAVLCCVLFAGIIPLHGQNSHPADLNTLSLEQLGNVEVTTTSKEPEQIWQTPAAIYVITQEDLRRYGATTIPEALRLAPGVEVARIDSDHWAVGVRGFGGEFSKSLLVMIDGRSVYSPLFAGVYWQVQDTLMEDIDRIEVIRGPGGTIWGANAVNGIINIITKKAKDTHGSLVSLGGGSVDQGNGSSRFGGTLGKDLDYRVYAKGFLRGPELHPDGKNFDEWRAGQIGFRGDWQPNRRDSATLQGDFYIGRDGERVAASFYNPPSMKVIDAPHSTSGQNVTGNWRRQFSENSDIELRGYFDRTTRFSPQLDEVRNTFDLDLLYHVRAKGRQDFLFGVGGRWSPDAITPKYATLDFTPHNETDSIYSWFLKDDIKLLPSKLSLVLGSKFEHNNRSGFEVQPNVRLLWTPSEHQTFWVGSTRAVRTPSRLDQDLQLTDFLSASPAIFLRVVGTKNFRSEQLVGTEAGYRTLLARKLYLDVAIFRNYYNYLYGYGQGTGFLEVSPAPAHLVLQEPLANALKGNTAGGEITPDWRPVNWLTLKGSYAYLHLYVHDRRGFTDTQNTASDNGSSPHHQVVVQPMFNLPGHTELDTTYRYVSALPAQKIKAYHTLDTRFGWHATHDLQLSVVGSNLLQPHHAEFGTDVNTIVGIKRSVYGSVVWTR